uniref:Uncharacterized protein n=1 Tax=Euplotes harpa TaxID=151035 RepID=A0A7S3JL75_9SPIT|mmetsp:Transcript_43080/g.50524  ORF Transcript_43080/g.50524 Transcript_43080/m.50524 type:complete len:358 (+) Transcript_43080:440-1513(+)
MCAKADLCSIDGYHFRPYDELMTKEDFLLHQIDDADERRALVSVQSFIDKCTAETFQSESLDKHAFSELMDSKLYRYCFVTSLKKLDVYQLPNEECFEGVAFLVMAFLRGCNKNDDCDYLRSIIDLAEKLHYDVEESEDAIVRTSLTEAIRRTSIWDNAAIWEKAIFKDFRDIIVKFKLPEDQHGQVNKDEVLKDVLFSRLDYYVSKLAYFEMDGKALQGIYQKFAKAYKFTEAQKAKLKSKVVIVEEDQNEDFDFSKESTQPRLSGSFTLNVNKWMTGLGKIGTTAVTKMKTFIKKKEVVEESKNALDDEEVDEFNPESTDISKSNSECSPPKDNIEAKGEIDVNLLKTDESQEAV